ncbi:hypothetical protein OUZ56_029277 [Daphnia magna]|uniref:Uncharacterized protein n=1 Tax=Daphnia magna TaxID=35525 RepID=A0ABR0B6C3_9CRUS|nr:hypothetical protein OUZ56_029277 [Daphnia magna]
MKLVIALTPSPFFELQIFIFLWYNTAVTTISLVSPPSGPHATTFFSSSCRGCLRLHLIAVFVDGFAFISVSSSSWPSFSTPSPRCRLRLRFSRRVHRGSSPWYCFILHCNV